MRYRRVSWDNVSVSSELKDKIGWNAYTAAISQSVISVCPSLVRQRVTETSNLENFRAAIAQTFQSLMLG